MAYSSRSRSGSRSRYRSSGRVSSQRRSTARKGATRGGTRRAAAKRQPQELRIVIEQRGVTSTRPEAMQIERPAQKAKF